jgi:CheY-like chemotaxis protein
VDIGLPGFDGYEVARVLRGRSRTPNSKLIAVSGYGQPDDIAHARAAGFDHHFVKTVAVERLLAVPTSKSDKGPQ